MFEHRKTRQCSVRPEEKTLGEKIKEEKLRKDEHIVRTIAYGTLIKPKQSLKKQKKVILGVTLQSVNMFGWVL